MGKIVKGVTVGILGAGIAWLLTTKKGKEVREQALDAAADVYEMVVRELKSSKAYAELSRNQYLKMVKKVVSEYVAEHEIGASAKAMITKLVSAQWETLSGELRKIKKKAVKKTSTKKSATKTRKK